MRGNPGSTSASAAFSEVSVITSRLCTRSIASRSAAPRNAVLTGAVSLPFTELLAPDGTMKDPDALRAIFAARGADGARRLVTSCGTGVTACVLALGALRAGLAEPAVYDGSWTEWASRPETPKATA